MDGRKVSLYELASHNTRVLISNFGARIVSINYNRHELVYGPKDFAGMQQDTCYCGAVCGRVANRIAAGQFQLDGVNYRLDTNNGPNHLHGGFEGFDQRLWDVEFFDSNCLILRLISPHLDQYYPGQLEVTATYRLLGDKLSLVLEAECDRPSICAMTNHVYFNLAAGDIETLSLKVNASAYTPKDENNIPDGSILPVAGSDFDLRTAETFAKLGQRAALQAGIDHNFVLSNKSREAAIVELCNPQLGIKLSMASTLPGVQVYTGEYLPSPRAGVALEPQNFPDAVNHEHFPSCRICPEEPYFAEMSWQFSPVE